MEEKRRVLEDLKYRNKNNMNIIAGEYFGNNYTYSQTFKMFDDYKKAFISLDGINDDPITICSPSTIASVNAFYGAMDANKIVNLTGPGFLFAYPKKYTSELNSKTVFIFDSFLSEEFIDRLKNSGVKNIIVTSVSDYMNPKVKDMAISNGIINDKDFLDSYIKTHKHLPSNMNFIRLSEFALEGSKIKENYNFKYEPNKIGAYFLTGATTSQYPKGVKLYADGFNNMAKMYDKMWFDFKPGDRQTIFIPLFYATGAVHGVHAGLFSGMTLIYKPKYDRFSFGKDLMETKAKIALVAPSHVATLENSNLKDNSLSHVKYVFVGGEAIMPAQMKKFRQTARRLGIKYILNGYGMTETGSMSGISDKHPINDADVTIKPTPGVQYRIVDPITREKLPDNTRGILEKKSPCQTAGYINSNKDKDLFTPDGWINTGDIAIRYIDGRYRVFGRQSDCFKNNNINYSMFDIEEKILEHPGVSEAEVIKFNVLNNEYPAIVIVLKQEWINKKEEILKYISNLKASGIEFLIGTKFIDSFKTNPVTSKRDYLSLNEDCFGYYKYDDNMKKYIQTDINNNKIVNYTISSNEIVVSPSKNNVKNLIKK